MEEATVRFYYPVQVRGAEGILVHCAFEEIEGMQGVSVYEERGEPIIFPQWAKAGAIALCQCLNARERRLPTSLPSSAKQFFLLYGQSNGKL
jgi:hypothetical protein